MRKLCTEPMQAVNEQGKIMSYRSFSIITNTQWLIVLLLIFVHIIKSCLFSTVPTYSMYPTMNRGTWCIGSYDLHEIQRGDIVTFFPHAERPSTVTPLAVLFKVASGEELYIKRVMGLPGDTVAVSNGQLIVNGTPLEEPYINGGYIYYEMAEIKLAADEYFMMGDNRNNSLDSHVLGPIPASHLCSKVLWYISPPIDWS